jgi:uncharacterized membrane protein
MMHHLFNLILATHYPPKDSLFNWFFGPQMIGVFLLIIGGIQYRYPPKKINDLYGYRTDTSKRNQETWDEAQRYSALLMIKSSIYVIVLGFIIAAILNLSPLSVEHRFAFTMPLFFAGAVAPILIMLTKTEKHLTKKFGEK